MTYASAPGKIVLWGEYAVLTGAPAGVMALSNRASIRMKPSADKRWHFDSKGFFSKPASCPSDQLPNTPQSTFVSLILAHWGYTSLAQCSAPLRVTTDSSAFFAANQKLGLGSSAAVCTATYRALCEPHPALPRTQRSDDIASQLAGRQGQRTRCRQYLAWRSDPLSTGQRATRRMASRPLLAGGLERHKRQDNRSHHAL